VEETYIFWLSITNEGRSKEEEGRRNRRVKMKVLSLEALSQKKKIFFEVA
jgi:hypothetical protein